MTREDILRIIEEDVKMMEVIQIAEKLNFPDWLIGSGFVRNKIWNFLSGKQTDGWDATDVDLVYLDFNSNDQKRDEKLVKRLNEQTGLEWEIRNNAYKYKSNELSGFNTAEEVISQWPETVTCIGVRLREEKLELVDPYGIEDIVNFIVRPSPKFTDGIERIKTRMEKKKWLQKWPQIKVELD